VRCHLRSRVLFGTLAAAASVSAGCAYRVYSPPARSLPLESPRTLPDGRMSVAAEGAVHGVAFGPDIDGGTVRVARGVGGGEASIEGTALFVNADSAAHTEKGIYMLRGGFRMGGRIFAGGVGLGAAASAAGVALSPDFSLTAGWENCYFVPFAALRTGVSVPIGAKAVDIGKPEDGVGTHVDTPRTTAIFNGYVGAKLPLVHRCAEAPQWRVALLAGVGWTWLIDAEDHQTYPGFSVGLTYNF
jgi:hypothetical protein